MAFTCGFFNSVDGDRLYTAEDMNNPYKGIVSNGIIADTEDSNGLQVVVDQGLNIIVKQGKGIFFDKWSILDADMPMTIPTPHVTYPRIDSVIVRVDISEDVRNGQILYKTGESALTPVPVTLENTLTVKEYRLCNITVAQNSTEITQAEIEDTRPTGECGFVSNLLQNSDITATYRQWQQQFENWFKNLQENTISTTAVMSFATTYTTKTEDETDISLAGTRYTNVTDILHVYINGLLLIPDIDYTVNGFDSITLTLGVNINTPIGFIVYKSVDVEGVDTIVSMVQDLSNRIVNLEGKTDEPLWVGSVYPIDTDVVQPSKRLSECKSGWLLLWSDYNESSSSAGNFDYATSFIPKKRVDGIWSGQSFLDVLGASLADSGDYFMTVKKLAVHDDRITGFVGNAATTYSKDICLRAIYEV